MKKVLLVMAMLSVCLMTGCAKKVEVTPTPVPQITNQPEVANPELSKSFEERTSEARALMNKGDELDIESLGYVSKEHFVAEASLAKKDNYYVMKLQLTSSQLFNKEDIENAYNQAQEDGESTFASYTFYKNNDIPVTFDTEYTSNWFKNLKEDGILAYSSELGLVKFMATPNNPDKYCVAIIRFDGAPGFMITEFEKDIEVTLLPSDVVRISINRGEKDMERISVEEFYNKTANGEKIELDGYSDFVTLDLSNVGDSRDYYAGYQNAIEFNEDEIVVNYTIGGV